MGAWPAWMARSAPTSFSIFPLVQQALLVELHPSFLLHFLLGIERTRHRPQMLPSVVEVDHLQSPRKGFGDKIPYPFRAVTDDHFLLGSAPTSLESFPIDALAQLLCGFEGPGVGGGIRIAEGQALLVPGGWREPTSQLGLPGRSGLAVRLALPTQRLFLHHGHARTVHWHLQDGNGLADEDGEIQLQGFLDHGLLALGDIASAGLSDTLHRFGGHLQTGQQLHLLAAVIERSLLPHPGMHAAHPGLQLISW